MRAIIVVFLAVIVILIGIPALVVGSMQGLSNEPPPVAYSPTIRLFVTSTGQEVDIDLEEYVKGVVAAEMPAEFHLEALKAQAVAARTYVVKRARLFGGQGCDLHPTADICDDPAHCQAWLPTAELQQRWGMIDYQSYWQKISEAVMATAGEIITYQGVAIDPLFHSTCGGKTEDAGNVWQRSLPYLQPVDCPYCQDAPKFRTEQRFAVTAFVAAAQSVDGAVAVTASQITSGIPPLTIASSTSTGRVSTVTIGGRTMKATQLRQVLGLNSTNFSFAVEGDAIVFNVQGYGHGVGLCQYGANGQGKAGRSYQQILTYYYQGTSITQIK